MILLDSGPLIALLDDRDRLNRRAIRELKRTKGREQYTCAPVLTEVAFALPGRHHRRRLKGFLERFSVRSALVGPEDILWPEVLEWLDQYPDHDPDWADGWIAVLCPRAPLSPLDLRSRVSHYLAPTRWLLHPARLTAAGAWLKTRMRPLDHFDPCHGRWGGALRRLLWVGDGDAAFAQQPDCALAG